MGWKRGCWICFFFFWKGVFGMKKEFIKKDFQKPQLFSEKIKKEWRKLCIDEVDNNLKIEYFKWRNEVEVSSSQVICEMRKLFWCWNDCEEEWFNYLTKLFRINFSSPSSVPLRTQLISFDHFLHNSLYHLIRCLMTT